MKLSKETIENLDYSSYVGIVKETNRPSGGIKTVHLACVNSFLDANKKVLEIGCNTGFTSRTIHMLTGSKVVGMDINNDSLETARNMNNKFGIDSKQVNFVNASATKIPFEDKSFDAVWLSNVLSFIGDKTQTISECLRVLKNEGFLIFVPIYYVKTPPDKLIMKVEKAIRSTLEIRSKFDWIKFIKSSKVHLEICFEKDFFYKDMKEDIPSYLEEVFNKPSLEVYDSDTLALLREKGTEFMTLFNENLKYAGFTLFVLQKREYAEERELFLSKEDNK
ncbi:MAG: methyltransferase domain-containing protein [Nanoarchaeota archaeon]|mgnify:CR=1 FL=1